MSVRSFLMTGEAAPFIPAGTCPVMNGPHARGPDEGSFMVADATTADGTASVRLVLWRCQFCGTLVTGIGRTGVAVDCAPGQGIHSQDFTWLEESVVLLDGGAGE